MPAGDENAVYFEDVHTGLLRVPPGISQHLGVRGTDTQRGIFDRGTAVEYYTHCRRRIRRRRAYRRVAMKLSWFHLALPVFTGGF